jgi:hypothetical protein
VVGKEIGNGSACSRVPGTRQQQPHAHVRMDHARYCTCENRRSGSEVRTRLGSQSLGPCQRLQAPTDVWTPATFVGLHQPPSCEGDQPMDESTTSWVGLALGWWRAWHGPGRSVGSRAQHNSVPLPVASFPGQPHGMRSAGPTATARAFSPDCMRILHVAGDQWTSLSFPDQEALCMSVTEILGRNSGENASEKNLARP